MLDHPSGPNQLDPRRAALIAAGRPERNDLSRTVDFKLLRADEEAEGDGLTIDGYGAVFNSVTHISSWEGDFDEVIAQGAFRKSIRENTPRMQFDHGHHPLLGSLPIGCWDLVEEDEHGLHVVGRLTDNWLIQPFRDAIRAGAIDGMSFRFAVIKDEWTDKDGKKVSDSELNDLLWYGAGDRGPILRTLKEMKVSEVGPVTWPAYPDTSVGVRSTSTVVDLGRLDLRTPGARAQLARAVALTEWLATHEPSEAPPKTTGAPMASAATPEPQSTERTAAEHPVAGPPSTNASAGEHSSANDRLARMRAKASRVRGVMEKIDKKG